MQFNVVYNNGRSLKVIPYNKTEIIKEKGRINMIRFDEESLLCIGDKLPVLVENDDREYNTYYIVKNIYKHDNYFLISEFPITPVEDLMVPLLQLTKENLLIDYDFCGSYSNFNNHPLNKKKNVIFLMYRWNPFEYYDKFITSLTNNPLFIEQFKSEDNRFDVLAFKIAPVFEIDVNKIFRSDYLNLTAYAKSTIVKFHNDPNLTNVINDNPEYRTYLEKELDTVIPKNIPLYSKYTKKRVSFVS